MAIGSLILGFFSVLFPAALGAIILGHISRSEIRKSAGRLKGAGMALAGLILGYLGIAVIPVLIIAAIAIPNLLRSRIAANEASAVGSVRTLVTAQTAYAETHPDQGYACSLAALRATGSTAGSTGLIDDSLASGQKHGYEFIVACGEADPTAYVVGASPVTQGSSGIRTFCADQSGVVRQVKDGTLVDCVNSGEPLM
jgi:type II secretory pathway pseudopilin PulG